MTKPRHECPRGGSGGEKRIGLQVEHLGTIGLRDTHVADERRRDRGGPVSQTVVFDTASDWHLSVGLHVSNLASISVLRKGWCGDCQAAFLFPTSCSGNRWPYYCRIVGYPPSRRSSPDGYERADRYATHARGRSRSVAVTRDGNAKRPHSTQSGPGRRGR